MCSWIVVQLTAKYIDDTVWFNYRQTRFFFPLIWLLVPLPFRDLFLIASLYVFFSFLYLIFLVWLNILYEKLGTYLQQINVQCSCSLLFVHLVWILSLSFVSFSICSCELKNWDSEQQQQKRKKENKNDENQLCT